jgi:hypothetical protein
VKVPIFLAFAALLSGCIPIGIRGTSIVDAGTLHPATAARSAAPTATMPGPPPYRRA